MPGYGADPRVTAWPAEAFTYGRLYPDVKTPASPAAGSPLNTTVPGGELWRLMAIRFVFTASAAVATRVPKLAINDQDGNEFIRLAGNGTVTANGAALAQWVRIPGLAYSGGDGSLVTSLPELFIPSQWTIVLTATNIQAADQLSSIRMWFEIAKDGDFAYATGVHQAAAAAIE